MTVRAARQRALNAAPIRTVPPAPIAPGTLGPGALPPGVTAGIDQVVGAGQLARQDYIDLAAQVTGQLAYGNVGGLGALALLNQINLATQTIGTLDANTQVVNLGQLAYANSLAADQIGAGTLAAGVIYAGGVQAHQVDARGLTIRTPDGQIVLDASRRLQVQDLTDAGVFATLNAIGLGDPRLTGFGGLAGANAVELGTSQVVGNLPNTRVTGLGSLALQSVVNLSSQVTGALSSGNVSGLGALALLNRVNLSTQTTGALNGQTQVTNLGNLAYANAVAANQIGAGTLSAGVVYAGVISVDQLLAGEVSVQNGAARIGLGVEGSGFSLRRPNNATGTFSVPLLRVWDTQSGTNDIWPATFNSSNRGRAVSIQGVAAGTAQGGFDNPALRVTGAGPAMSVAADIVVASNAPGTAVGMQVRHLPRGHQANLCGNGFAFFAASGGYGPFTGCHDGALDLADTPELGDILVDVEVICRRGIEDTLTLVATSTQPGQRGAVGVATLIEQWGEVPAAARAGEGPSGEPIPSDEFLSIRDVTQRVIMASVGEGQIAVCGEGGDIAVGDLIVCSSMRGKGMRQHGDVVRSYTVAKAREAVTFTDPGDVRLVACIYLCG